MNEVDEAQRALAEEFAFLGDWMERYQYLIDLGRRLPALDADEVIDANKIRGCQSQVWFVTERDGDRLQFRANSDAAIVSGLIAILLRIYSGRRPEDILSARTDFVSELGFEQHLSPTRSNGLAAMLNTIQQHAADASSSA
ncbi:MAG: SufE family protein [Pseudomonadota bacterium]